MFAFKNNLKLTVPSKESALPGRTSPMPVVEPHFVNGRPLVPPYPDGLDIEIIKFPIIIGVTLELISFFQLRFPVLASIE